MLFFTPYLRQLKKRKQNDHRRAPASKPLKYRPYTAKAAVEIFISGMEIGESKDIHLSRISTAMTFRRQELTRLSLLCATIVALRSEHPSKMASCARLRASHKPPCHYPDAMQSYPCAATCGPHAPQNGDFSACCRAQTRLGE